MNPVDFIQENIEKQLTKDGYSFYVATNCAREAVQLYKRKSYFAKGKAFDECMKLAKKQAKQMGKSL